MPDSDCVWIEDEPKPKIKNECQTFEPIARHITLDILKRLLLFGVEATVEAANRRVWPAMDEGQKDRLREIYEIVLLVVRLVRELDRVYHE